MLLGSGATTRFHGLPEEFAACASEQEHMCQRFRVRFVSARENMFAALPGDRAAVALPGNFDRVSRLGGFALRQVSNLN
jgi:hypothetical protein